MPIEIQGLCPLISVYDMPESVAFYTDVLGFEVLTRSPTYAIEDGVDLFHWALLRCGEAQLMINTAYDEGERPAERDREREAQHRDTGLYLGCPDVDGAYAQLRELGVVCEPPEDASYGMRQLSLRDPDGYGLTLQWRVKVN